MIRPVFVAASVLALLVPPTAHTADTARHGLVAVASVRADGARPGPAARGGGPVGARVVVDAAGPARTAERAAVLLTYENVGGDGEWVVDWGDGSHPDAVSQFDTGCGGVRPGARGTQRMTHVYRYAGTWPVTVTFTPRCRGAQPVTGRGEVLVTQGAALSNGPRRPVFEDLSAREPLRRRPDQTFPPNLVELWPQVDDADGFLRRLVIRWGDGSPDTVFDYPPAGCAHPPGTWPTTMAWGDDRPWWGIGHEYPRPGRYRAYVTVTTTGCDGGDAQTATASTRVEVPALR